MRTTYQLAVCCSAAFALASSTFAATLPQRGLASVLAAGVSIDNGPVQSGSIDPIYLKSPLNQTSPLAPWSVASANLPLPFFLPDYSADALWGTAKGIAAVDGQSRGVDQVPPPDAQGAPDAGSNLGNWLAYVVSVKEGTPALGNPHLTSVKAANQAIGAELISFYAASSLNIDASIPGTTRIEATAASLGYDGSLASTPDIDAIDYGIGVRTYGGPSSSSQVIFQASNRYFFTLTPSSADDWTQQIGPICWVGPLPHFAHPADIYVKTWTPPTTSPPAPGFWGPVELYRTYDDLDLTAEDDVDALSVTQYFSNDVIVFSTAGPNPLSQLLINNGKGTTKTLTDRGDGGSYSVVADNLGLGGENDDIDGLCPIDPKEVDLLDQAVATPSTSTGRSPLAGLLGLNAVMDVSVERGTDPTTLVDSMMLQVSGWGGLPEQDCDLRVWLYFGPEAIEANADPFGNSLIPSGGVPTWVPIPVLYDRPASMDQWELSLPVPASNGLNFMGVLVTAQAKPSAGGGFIAGSLVMQTTF